MGCGPFGCLQKRTDGGAEEVDDGVEAHEEVADGGDTKHVFLPDEKGTFRTRVREKGSTGSYLKSYP